MDPQHLAALEQRHGFDSWRAPDTEQDSFFVWRYLIGGRELPGWRPHRIQRVDAPGVPPGHHSIWQRTDGRGRVLLAMDAYETVSAAAARQLMITLLAEFQSPLVERDAGLGDVGFTVPGEGAVLLARGNLVVLIRNAGEETLALNDIARRFDENLRSSPDGRMPWEEAPAISRLDIAPGPARVGQPVSIALEAAAPTGGDLWFKLFGPPGTIETLEGGLRFTPAIAGPQEIVAHAITREGAAASRTLRLDVQPTAE